MAATPPLSELDPILASLNELKPPGANKGKIGTITNICVKNIQAEQSIVQSFYRALKKAPPTHKLGALYVIDSVIRQWCEKAKKAGEDINSEGRGEPGTYAAGIKRVAELMPALLDSTVKVIPAEQKPKLDNLVDIWDRSKFFPSKSIAEFKLRLSEAAAAPPSPLNSSMASTHEQSASEKFKQSAVSSSASIPSPPQQQQQQQTQQSQQPAQPPAPPADVNSILAALANAAPRAAPPPAFPQPSSQRPAASAVQPPPNQPPALPGNLAALLAQTGLALPPSQPTASAAPPFGVQQTPVQQFGGSGYPQQFQGYPPQPPPSIPQHFAQAPPPPQQHQAASQQDLLGPLRGILPQNILNDPQKLMQALNLLQELQSGGLPMEQWGPVIQAFSEQTSNQPSGAAAQNAYDGNNRGRGRSRSPDRDGRGRGSPVYGNYDEMAARRHGDGNGQGGRERARYRQRSPMRDSPGPAGGRAMNGNSMQPKVVLFDSTIAPGCIKVLSRTLFVGGASGTQHDIQSLFERFGRVQSCIANRDKRHAFVKMTTRQYALNAKAGMEALQAANDKDTMGVARQTKWGVGFGPRECCDYNRGESTIPINKLTEADVKWLLSAEYGGTGGKELQGGMVLEEPDIEIGAGVSSKAMSKRVVPDGGPAKRGRDERERDRGGRRQERERDRFRPGRDDVQMGGMPMEAYGYARPEPVAVATPPAVPGFGFTLPGR